MIGTEDVPLPLTERIDTWSQDPNVVVGTIIGLFVIVAIAGVVSHLGSDTHGRPP